MPVFEAIIFWPSTLAGRQTDFTITVNIEWTFFTIIVTLPSKTGAQEVVRPTW